LAIDWNNLLSNQQTLAIIEGMMDKDISRIEPSVDEEGRVSYSIGQGKLDASAGAILESLVKAGFLEKKSEGRLLACPQHEGSIDLAPRLRCPHCSSMQLIKGSLFQHTCGFVGAPDVFVNGCPHCKKASQPQTLKAVGAWFECKNCQKRFAQPNVYLYCKRYQHDFAIGLATLLDQASYSLTEEAQAAVKGKLGMVMAISNGLKAAGVGVELSGRLLGASGVQHDFDLLLGTGTNRIPIDVRMGEGGEVEVVGVLSTYAKALDTKASPAILIAIPSASEDAKKTASAYGMVLLDGKDANRITQSILEASARANPAAQKPQARAGVSSTP
jgi:hypothetical protein